jgi:hypothetical protein
MKNIHLLPTDKPSRLVKLNCNSELRLSNENFGNPAINQHVYITSSEEIKEGDWVIADYVTGCIDLKGNPINDNNYYIVKPSNIKLGNVEHGQQLLFSFNNLTHEIRYCKKIILTTDPDLIKDGVQAIDDEFLEWFVKNPSCEQVEVKIEYKDGYGNWSVYDKEFWYKHGNKPKFGTRFKIIIPQEEPKQEYQSECICDTECRGFVNVKCKNPKQETLEEAAYQDCKKSGFNNTSYAAHCIQSFINGTKYQVDRMYSEEEVFDLLNTFNKHTLKLQSLKLGNSFDVKEWFENFKKIN